MTWFFVLQISINNLNAELNPTCHLLALLGAHHILHVSRIRVKCEHSDYATILLTFIGSEEDFNIDHVPAILTAAFL
jgi:hypothetical protein